MNFLFLFMDGVGLTGDKADNPLSQVPMPSLVQLLGGQPLTAAAAPYDGERATLLALDANLGVPDLPQSATGQGTLVTGKNIPAMIGKHYGPKPTPDIAAIILEDNLFIQLHQRGYQAALLNAYPQGYFDAIESGKRLYSAIPLAVTSAGIPLKTAQDLMLGEGFSADFTGRGWREHLGYQDAPLMSPQEAGQALAQVAMSYDLAFFEYWPSDFAGHRQDKEDAARQLENFDQMLGGLLQDWEDDQGLILITSDHGNIEDLGTRRHTDNPVPGLVIGARELRQRFCAELETLVDVAPAILQFYPARPDQPNSQIY
jgi:hypothetical protein